MHPLLKALRPHHWVKNTLILLPCIAGSHFSELSSPFPLLIGFFTFSLAASFGYLLNDIADVEFDKLHVRKKFRPIASGKVSIPQAYSLAGGLLLLVIAGGVYLGGHFSLLIGAYMLLTQIYTRWLKRLLLIDLFCLAALYTCRVIAGILVTPAVPTAWLFIFIFLLFSSLATLKRYIEVKDAADIAKKYHLIQGRGYSTKNGGLLQILGILTGYAAAATLLMYTLSPQVAEHYNSPLLLLGAPVLLILWLNRAWTKAQRGRIHSDPVVYALKDGSSYITLALLLILLGAAKFLALF